MSIFKETFRDFVFEQLRLREEIIKQGNDNTNRFGSRTSPLKVKDKEVINIKIPEGAFYTNTVQRQCTIRMSSGVNLKSENSVLEAGEYEGSKHLVDEGLAIRYILEGGVPTKSADFISKDKENRNFNDLKTKGVGTQPRGSLSNSNVNFGKNYGSSYGDPYLRSDAKDGYGIVPMPGIKDANIRTKTAYGSLREAKINFTCHNKRQLEILELLYMRPGFPVLLEWGWTPYITIEKNKDGEIINKEAKRESYFPYMWEFFEKDQDINGLQKLIVDKKRNTGGNYDGFIGFVKNFSFKSRSDGGYECSTDLIAMGECLEGLKGRRTGRKLSNPNDKKTTRPVDELEFFLVGLTEYCTVASLSENIEENNNNVSRTARQEGNGEKSSFTEKSNVFGNWIQVAQSLFELGGLIYDNNDVSQEMLDVTYEDNKSSKFERKEKKSIKKLFKNKKKGKDKSTKIIKQKWIFNTIGDTIKEDGAVGELIAKDIEQIEEITNHFIIRKGEAFDINIDDFMKLNQSKYNYVRWDFIVMIMNQFVLERYNEINDDIKTITELTILRDQISSNTGEINEEPLQYSQFKFGDKASREELINIELEYKDETPWYKRLFGQGQPIGEGTKEILKSIDPESLVDQSFNPAICLLPHQINPSTSNTHTNEDYPRSIGGIFFNLQHLLETYRSLRYTDEGGLNEDFSLFKWIKKIWDDVNSACANTHNFTIQSEHERPNVIRIIDMSFDSPDLKPENLYDFKIQSNESIVRDFFYNTTIPSSLSATIAIAAQSPKSIDNVDAVTFANFNKNIYYRFYRAEDGSKAYGDTDEGKKAKREEMKKLLIRYKSNVKELYQFSKQILSGEFDLEDETNETIGTTAAINYAKNLERTIIDINSRYPLTHSRAGYLRSAPRTTRSAVIPLKFNAKIDGISGIVIGNVFKIDKSRLPAGYQEKDIAFVVMAESQNISAGQDWTTDIQGQLILLDVELNEKIQEDEEEIQVPEAYKINPNELDNFNTVEVDNTAVATATIPRQAIEYTYEFRDTVDNDGNLGNEGDLWISNNAGYPPLGQGFTNIESQGGSEAIIANQKQIMDTSGDFMDGVLFPKTGTLVDFPYKGRGSEKTEASRGTSTSPPTPAVFVGVEGLDNDI